jgi:hypothetical protein
MMAHVHARALIFASALLAIACDNEDDKDTSSSGDDDGGSTGDDGAPSTMTMPGDEGSGGDDGPSMWVVGEDGEMLRVGWDGAAARYPLDVAHDFYGIACRGEDEAWVVGAAGTLLRTANEARAGRPSMCPRPPISPRSLRRTQARSGRSETAWRSRRP